MKGKLETHYITIPVKVKGMTKHQVLKEVKRHFKEDMWNGLYMDKEGFEYQKKDITINDRQP